MLCRLRSLKQTDPKEGNCPAMAKMLSPNLVSRLNDPIEFSPHFIFTHHLRVDTAEAALGAQA
jgi:hypothetical protein